MDYLIPLIAVFGILMYFSNTINSIFLCIFGNKNTPDSWYEDMAYHNLMARHGKRHIGLVGKSYRPSCDKFYVTRDKDGNPTREEK